MATEAFAIPASRRRRVNRSGRSPNGERLRSGPRLTVSESRRAGNRERNGLVAELRCECARSNCTATVPAVAEAHRGIADAFVVKPAHFEGGVVVRAADRFFVVEAAGYAFVKSQSGVQR